MISSIEVENFKGFRHLKLEGLERFHVTKAIEIVVDAIKSIPNAQTFVTTHSPMIVQQVGIDSLLLFSKRGNEIVIEHGRDNKILHELDGVPDLATVFASRVLE